MGGHVEGALVRCFLLSLTITGNQSWVASKVKKSRTYNTDLYVAFTIGSLFSGIRY